MKRTRAGNRYTAKCKHCLVELSGKPDRLHQHVLQCNNWPVSEKTSYIQKISEETHAPHKRTHDDDNTSLSKQMNKQMMILHNERSDQLVEEEWSVNDILDM
ncbi:4443_t:CDS:2 [Scutellospora calospora]|uniref:4443_t:CDS:1 n=1 Tax=Scutellospora calospora TaxID=85575 RepID=A0ACA9K8Q0_9GLOM|nr:4443_t:CDS:2 [Scutellospora calospora]